MFVTKTVEYEISDYLGEDLINNVLDDDEYTIGVDDKGNTITYYDLDAKNKIIFLEALQNQINTEITERINYNKET